MSQPRTDSDRGNRDYQYYGAYRIAEAVRIMISFPVTHTLGETPGCAPTCRQLTQQMWVAQPRVVPFTAGIPEADFTSPILPSRACQRTLLASRLVVVCHTLHQPDTNVKNNPTRSAQPCDHIHWIKPKSSP